MVTIRVGEKATFISLPVSGFADVVEVVVLWFSSGLYSSLWGWFFSVYGVMACALFLSFTLRGGSVGDVVSGLFLFCLNFWYFLVFFWKTIYFLL